MREVTVNASWPTTSPLGLGSALPAGAFTWQPRTVCLSSRGSRSRGKLQGEGDAGVLDSPRQDLKQPIRAFLPSVDSSPDGDGGLVSSGYP